MEPDDDKTQTHSVLTNGTMVGHYRIVEKIGAGGMGEVFLAQDTELDRKVALKFLPSHLCQDEECRERFKREAQAAAKLDHPNIVPIHEVDEFQNRPYFVMSVIEGLSLREYIASLELFVERIFEISLQICEGLQAAHDKGIIHRDIKPSNILIDSHGRARIVDFGLASIRGSEHLTKTGSTLGTIGYMSPEQIQVKEVDRRSDLFSFGVVLYEMITGRLPFKGDTEATVMNSVLNDTPEPLSRFKSGVSGELERIVSKLLEKDPQLRYQSAAGVISDLKRLSAPATVTTKPRKDWWNRYVVPAAVVVLLAMVVYWYKALDGNRRADVPPADKIMLAVLPFENLGDPEDEYFADGMTDEIIARLNSVSRLGVITRSSVMAYKDSEKSLAEIARELNVDYLVSGTIRWQKSVESFDRVKVSPRLIEPSSGTEMWATVYDDSLTEVFAVQSNIAGHIIASLDVTLQAPEQQQLDYIPTQNMEAYSYYRRGKELSESTMDGWVDAVNMFQIAIDLDSGFALAYAGLSMVYSNLYWYEIADITIDQPSIYKLAAQAMEINADLPEPHLAMGYYFYYCRRDFTKALGEFETARRLRPGFGDALYAIHLINRRLGKYEKALEYGQEALRLDPLSYGKRGNLFATAAALRELDVAIRLAEEGMALFPRDESFGCFKAMLYLDLNGNVSKAREMLDSIPQDIRTEFWNVCAYEIFFATGRYDSARACITWPVDSMTTLADSAKYYVLIAETYFFEYDSLGQSYFDSARVCLETYRARGTGVRGQPPPSLGLVYAALGKKDDAIEAAEEMVNLMPLSEDAYLGPVFIENLARTYARVGEFDLAIDQLEILLDVPGPVTPVSLRIVPDYGPLRDHPRFQELLEKYENKHGSG